MATARLISKKKINGLRFRREGTYYDGGRFEFLTGDFTGKTLPEKFVNCGVFAFALLQTFDCTLLNWSTWPDADAANRDFLEIWLNEGEVPPHLREAYYHKTKIVRGKHVLASPLTATQPSPYTENEPLANAVVKHFQEMV